MMDYQQTTEVRPHLPYVRRCSSDYDLDRIADKTVDDLVGSTLTSATYIWAGATKKQKQVNEQIGIVSLASLLARKGYNHHSFIHSVSQSISLLIKGRKSKNRKGESMIEHYYCVLELLSEES